MVTEKSVFRMTPKKKKSKARTSRKATPTKGKTAGGKKKAVKKSPAKKKTPKKTASTTRTAVSKGKKGPAKGKTAAGSKTTAGTSKASTGASSKAGVAKAALKAKAAPKKKARKPGLTPAQLKACRNELMLKRAIILGDLSRMEVSALRASEQDSSLDNMADFGSDNYEQDFTLSLMENVEGVIQQIDDALKRIEDKSYGICESCGCDIPKARIKAIPYARFCVKCQSEQEDV